MKGIKSIPLAAVFLFFFMGAALGALDFYTGDKAQSRAVVDLKY